MKVYHNETYVSQDGFSIEVDKIELFIMVREYGEEILYSS